MIFLKLFYEFFKVGLFSVGGGLATIPFLEEMAQRTGWFSVGQLADMIAISESTPGPIGVNMATYVGFTTAGVLGSLVATLGLITPSVIVILIIIQILNRFRESSAVQSVFTGLRPASLALICAAGISLVKVSLLNLDLWKESGAILDLLNWKCILLAVAVYFLIKKFKGHPGIYLGASAVLGIVFKLGA